MHWHLLTNRADKGKYSVLVAQSGALKRERTSRFREILMTEALNKVQRMDPEKFHRTVSIYASTHYCTPMATVT